MDNLNEILEKTLRLTKSGMLSWEYTGMSVKHDYEAYYNNWNFRLSNNVLRIWYGDSEYVSIYYQTDPIIFPELYNYVSTTARRFVMYDQFMELPE